MDGLTVPAGLVVSGNGRQVIMMAIIVEIIAGAVSMGLSDYLSMDTDEHKNEMVLNSGMRVIRIYNRW
jgi:VIT family